MTMQTVVREINTEYDAKLDETKNGTAHDVLEMSGSRAVWKEVLLRPVYSARRRQVQLLNVDNSMWLAVLYGIYGSDDMIVQVALSQIGNVGGEPYWSWYGFGSRVEWCACFVSWCADQCGYIETGVCPKYAGCVNGVDWFKEHNQWVDGSETPSPGMIIFYDWDSPNGESGSQDGLSDHTGIVERVENGIVYTVEGNTSDSCRQCHRAVGNYEILGYGVLIP